ncbi:MAG: 8-oxo-dGTP diphosphatase [Arthrobacter sp.]|jgi:8-oxo-dGTP diphosphatase|nr:8-oxo-dGTP diphosphatase [Arthrobacter sp.]
MPATAMSLVYLLDLERRRVLLGLKHRGLGTSLILGLGGHVEPGETSAEAAMREVLEEGGVVVDPADLTPVGQVRFRFPFKPSWDQDVDVFTATRWAGEPHAASDEITPRWYAMERPPLERMWDDARYWFPEILAGGTVDATFVFAEDNATVAERVPAGS